MNPIHQIYSSITDVYKMARGAQNGITLYIVGNSALSMTADKNLTITASEGLTIESKDYLTFKNEATNSTFNYIRLKMYVASDANIQNNQVRLTMGYLNSDLCIAVQDVGVSKVTIGAGGDGIVEVKSKGEINLIPNVYKDTNSEVPASTYNLHFTTSEQCQILPSVKTVAVNIDAFATIKDDKTYTLYTSDRVLVPTQQSHTIYPFLIPDTTDLADLETTEFSIKTFNHNITALIYKNGVEGEQQTFPIADDYATIENQCVWPIKPIPSGKKLIAVYMLNNSTENGITPTVELDMFGINITFPTILPAMDVYFGKFANDVTQIPDTFSTVINSNGTIELQDNDQNTIITFSRTMDNMDVANYVTIQNGKLTEKETPPEDMDIYVIYTGLNEEYELNVTNVIEYSDALIGSSPPVSLELKLDDEQTEGQGKFTLPSGLDHAFIVLDSNSKCQRIEYKQAEGGATTTKFVKYEHQILNASVSVINPSSKYLTEPVHNVVTLYGAYGAGFIMKKGIPPAGAIEGKIDA
ncbi:MAG: hypothetical protein IKC79_02255, partial [Clostridia bacterium]|nr:hypothetical protein [Clostridia bacterium]